MPDADELAKPPILVRRAVRFRGRTTPLTRKVSAVSVGKQIEPSTNIAFRAN